MTNQPDSGSATPLPDDENTSSERSENMSAGNQPAGDETIVGPHAETGNAASVDDGRTAPLAPEPTATPEMTRDQKIGATLDNFAQTLVPEHQDLNQTLAQTSLKPILTERADQTDSLMPCTQTQSFRARSVQSSDQTIAGGDSGIPGVSGTPDESSLDYLTLDKLGEGGMGTVHLAQQVALGREVALKQIHRQASQKQSVREEFLTEAVLTGKLEHPNIVPIYEVGEAAGGELFYAMKNVKGRAWDETIDDLTLDQNLEILIDVCDAIAFAHAEGVIHRDLKPQNIMTGGFGEVLVLDWGLAVLAEPGEDVQASAGGTPSYMAPEMITPPFLVGPRSDVYLLGAILFRFLTGKTPHAGKSAMSSLKAASQNEIVDPDADRLQELDPTGELLSVAMTAMATSPADRYRTVGEFQQAVREFEAHQESLKLAASAEAALQAAEQSGDYTRYSEAVFGFRQAVELWAGNASAVEGIERSRQAYALCAEQKGDYELGLSLLDASNAEQRKMVGRLTAARDERNARQGRLKRMKQGLAAAAVLMLAVVTVAAVWINQARIVADAQRKEAEKQRIAADIQRKEAERQRLAAERSAYASDMLLAAQDWDVASTARLRGLLDRHRSDPLRDFEWHYLDRCMNGHILSLTGHARDVRGVAYSPDGKRVASASVDNTVRIWDVVTGQTVYSLKGHSGPVWSVRFSPDGNRLASASFDSTVRIWHADTGQEMLTLKGHAGEVFSVCFSSDGEWLASASADQTVRVWDAGTGQQMRTLEGHTSQVVSVCFSPDGKRLASASGDGTVKLWDATTGKETATLTGHNGVVWSVCFSPDGQQLATAGSDRVIRLWNTTEGAETLIFEGHNGVVWSVCFSSDGHRLASASDDTTVKVWNTVTGKETLTLKGHIDDVYSAEFSPDGTRLASGGHDQTIRLWNTTTGQTPLTLNGHINDVFSICYSPDGTQLTVAGNERTFGLWDIASGQRTLTLEGHTQAVRTVVYSPDGTQIASASFDNTVKIWDVVTGRQTLTLEGHTDPVVGVDFSPDGQSLASASSDKTVKLWNAVTGQQTCTLKGHTAPVSSVCFSPDGQRLASASEDHTVKIWNVDTGELSMTLDGHEWLLSCVCFSPDGQWLASGSGDETVKVWNAVTGQETRTLKGHTNYVHSVCFNPDGTRLASASRDGSVKVWDASTGHETLSLKIPAENIWSVCFSPDGMQLASCSSDGTVKLWDARPWTPALKVQYETRGYLNFHAPRFSTVDDLRKAIQADRTINGQVRQQALDWSKLFWTNLQIGPN